MKARRLSRLGFAMQKDLWAVPLDSKRMACAMVAQAPPQARCGTSSMSSCRGCSLEAGIVPIEPTEPKGPPADDSEDIEDIDPKDQAFGTSTWRSNELSKERPLLLILLAGQLPLKAMTSTLGSKPTLPPGEAAGKLETLPKLAMEARTDDTSAPRPLTADAKESAVAKPPKTLSNPFDFSEAKLSIGWTACDECRIGSSTDVIEPKTPKLPPLLGAVLPHVAPPGEEEAKLSSDGPRLAGVAVAAKCECWLLADGDSILLWASKASSESSIRSDAAASAMLLRAPPILPEEDARSSPRPSWDRSFAPCSS